MFQKLFVRLRNKKIFASVVSGILLILVNTGVIDLELSHSIEGGIDTVLGLLVAMGVFSDPESHLEQVESIK